MWRVCSADGRRWVQHNDDGRVDTEPASLLGQVLEPGPVEIQPLTGAWYTPAGPGDPVAVFLRARNLVGGGLQVQGRPPRVPAAGGPAPDGILF